MHRAIFQPQFPFIPKILFFWVNHSAGWRYCNSWMTQSAIDSWVLIQGYWILDTGYYHRPQAISHLDTWVWSYLSYGIILFYSTINIIRYITSRFDIFLDGIIKLEVNPPFASWRNPMQGDINEIHPLTFRFTITMPRGLHAHTWFRRSVSCGFRLRSDFIDHN